MSSSPPADSGTRRSVHSDDSHGPAHEPQRDGPSSSIFDDDEHHPTAESEAAVGRGGNESPTAEHPAQDSPAAPPPAQETVPAAPPPPPAEPPVAPVAPPAVEEQPFFFAPAGADSAPSFFPGFGEEPQSTTPAVPYPVLLPYVAAVTKEPPRAAPASAARPQPTPTASRAKAAPRAAAQSKPVVMWLAMYAVFATLCLLYLIIQMLRLSPLENLPDVVPNIHLGTLIDTTANYESPHGKIASEDSDMPRGHTLRLGETEQYGHVKVTPLKVTRGPLAFADGAAPWQGEPATVLKLWLRFENVSPDQTFAPLDAAIVGFRGRTAKGGMERSNSFVARQGGRTPEDVVLLHDPSWKTPAGWNVGTADAPRTLAPGQSVEVYLPTNDYDEEQLKSLTGELVWRVQFRKGIADTGRGVTTLVEVVFHSDDIRDESATVAAL